MCRQLLNNPDNTDYLQEAKNRGLNCGSAATKNTSKATTNSTKQKASKSIFLSDKTYNEFLNLPKESKTNSCGFNRYEPNWQVIDKDLAPRIKGYNSKMDNENKVKGTRAMDVFREFASTTNYAFISENFELQEFLFDKLFEWANDKALTKTKVCYTNIENRFILKECEGSWKDPKGQDPAPTHDSSRTLEVIMGLDLSLIHI